MNDYFNLINKLSRTERFMLYEHIENMPLDLKTYLRVHINDDNMDKDFFNGRDRYMSIFNTVEPYLDKKRVNIIPSNHRIMYQNTYCTIMDKISQYSKKMALTFSSIMNAEVYDEVTLAKLESAIADIYETFEHGNEMAQFTKLLQEDIMPYFFEGVDLYFNAIKHGNLKENMIPSESHLFHNYHKMITNGYLLNRFALENDLPNLIYIYLKSIGMEDCIEKYHLFNRFKYTLKWYGADNEMMDSVESKINQLANMKTSIISATQNIFNPNKLMNGLLNEPKEDHIYYGNNTKERDGYIFFMKDINYFEDDIIQKLANEMKVLSRDEILHYVSNCDENTIDFHLSDNDIGHLFDYRGFVYGTVTDCHNYEVYTLGWYNGDFFIMFKNRNASKSVFGIGIEVTKNNEGRPQRKLFELKEENKILYQFISPI